MRKALYEIVLAASLAACASVDGRQLENNPAPRESYLTVDFFKEDLESNCWTVTHEDPNGNVCFAQGSSLELEKMVFALVESKKIIRITPGFFDDGRIRRITATYKQ
ncbi:MAG: hypothetical protein AABW87_04150 [Nanoarchaeota archaeon]|mgnify:FL=1